jgi:hypothetical protein
VPEVAWVDFSVVAYFEFLGGIAFGAVAAGRFLRQRRIDLAFSRDSSPEILS